VGSRPAEPDASRYPASARIESSFACLEVMASRSSLSGRGARCARGQRVSTHSSAGRRSESDAAVRSSIIQGQNLGYWAGCHGVPDRLSGRDGESAGPRESARERVRCRPYPGRPRACSTSEVVCPSARSMQAVTSGSETGMTGFVRTTASEVFGHALPVSSWEERGSRSLARAEAIHAARTTGHRSRPSEERRCLPLCGRANVPRRGRKRRRHVLPPCTGKVVGSLG